MFCSNCGHKNADGAKFCAGCGGQLTTNAPAPQYNAPQYANSQPGYAQQGYAQPNYAPQEVYHRLPKCTHCGHVGEWDVGPVIRPIDWIIGICLMLFLIIIGGLVYLVIVAAIRSNKDRREKVCRNCKAKNMFTFNY